jgi:hypothetical protein
MWLFTHLKMKIKSVAQSSYGFEATPARDTIAGRINGNAARARNLLTEMFFIHVRSIASSFTAY